MNDMKAFAEALSHLGDKSGEAFTMWIYYKIFSEATLFLFLCGVVIGVYRLIRKFQIAEYGERAK